MRLASTTADFTGLRNDIPAEHVKLFEGTGFKHLDYSFYRVVRPGSAYIMPGDAWKNEVLAARAAAEKLGFTFVQSHAPDGEHWQAGENRDALILATRRVIEACALLGIPSTVIHAAQHPDPASTPAEFIKENVKFLEEFYETAERFGVQLLVENGCEQNTPRYYLRTGGEMREFISAANHPLVFACWDTGHAHMRGMDQYRSILDLGDKLQALHIHDNYGDRDSHVMPFMGNGNFDQIMLGLQDGGYKGAFTFEGGAGVRRSDAWPHFRRPFTYKGRQINTLLEPDENLRRRYVGLMYATGRFMLEKYGFSVE